MVQRVTLRRRLPYNTNSNRRRIVRTPGGRLAYIYQKKPAVGIKYKCADCKKQLAGIAKVRPYKLRSLSKRQKTVNRAYGGSVCHVCVKQRIVRAFLVEEQKIVRRVLKAKQLLK